MESSKTILMDMDGVVSDFVGGVLQLFGHKPSEKSNWPVGERNLAKGCSGIIGGQVTGNEIWEHIDASEDFWYNLEPIPEGFALWQMLDALTDRLYFCTSPSFDPTCLSGKLQWMQKYFGRQFRKYFIGADKHILATPDTVLIDDQEKNIEKFFEAGGNTILIPQPWNALNGETFDPNVMFEMCHEWLKWS
jgi:5'(3')-deoxyribonucleotidase